MIMRSKWTVSTPYNCSNHTYTILCTDILFILYSLVKHTKLIFFTNPGTTCPQILKMSRPANHPGLILSLGDISCLSCISFNSTVR
jgi:hypothetical protein